MKRPFAPLVVAAAGVLACTSVSYAGERTATVTILDGQATLIHAATRWVAAEGAALDAEDIVETGTATSLMRLELDGGATLDLGPSSRVMIRPQLAGAGNTLVAYVLQGWAKLTLAKPRAPGKAVLASAGLDVMALDRDLVLHVQGGDAALFAESGTVQAQVQGKSGKAEVVKVDKGAFLARQPDGAVSVSARPVPAFIQAVPRAFMDTLPSRIALFKGKDVKLEPAGRLTYDDAQGWLNAEPRVRTRFLSRWKVLAQDESFRRPLVAQMALHPEWHKVLFPPKPASHPLNSSETVKP